ncbi:uncharacterized protein LOC142628341 [Castanea sativa]|uniref:uncharacterized protein LOC142628341 n=1 Tax=Castanea sativa TaxID=21020 RepID=UPI003F64F955
MDNILFTSELQRPIKLWGMGARLSLRGALLKMGIRNLDPRSKPELAGGNDMGTSSVSDFWKQVSDTNIMVDTLIATVTFAAAFTLPGGYIANGDDFEGLAVSWKKTAFRVFLIANASAFGFSTTALFVHFWASATIDHENPVFHRNVARRNAIFTNWSIGALPVAIIAAT